MSQCDDTYVLVKIYMQLNQLLSGPDVLRMDPEHHQKGTNDGLNGLQAYSAHSFVGWDS